MTNNLRLLCGNEKLVTVITITITIITITQVSPAWENNSVVMRSQDICNFLCAPKFISPLQICLRSCLAACGSVQGWLTLNGRKNENFAFTLTRA